MKTFVAVCLLACAAAFPQDLDLLEGSGEPPVEFLQDLDPLEGSGEPPVDIAIRSFESTGIDNDILRSEFEMSDDGQFQYGFETSDGTVVDAAGENRQIGDAAGMAMRGSYSYKSPEGIDVTVDWVADEAGFRATGPQVPKVPEYVTQLLKSLPAQPQAAVAVSSSEEAAPAAAAAPVVAVKVVALPPVFAVADQAVPVIPDESEFIVRTADSEDVAVSSSEDIFVALVELIVSATPDVAIIPDVIVEDAPAEDQVPVSGAVFEIVEDIVEDASAPIEDAVAVSSSDVIVEASPSEEA